MDSKQTSATEVAKVSKKKYPIKVKRKKLLEQAKVILYSLSGKTKQSIDSDMELSALRDKFNSICQELNVNEVSLFCKKLGFIDTSFNPNKVFTRVIKFD